MRAVGIYDDIAVNDRVRSVGIYDHLCVQVTNRDARRQNKQ